MNYHVMEYLERSNSGNVIGYVFLEEDFFQKWSRNPKPSEVKGYAVVADMESCAEWGMIPASRLSDYGRVCDKLPEDMKNMDDWLNANCRTGSSLTDDKTENELEGFYRDHLAKDPVTKEAVARAINFGDCFSDFNEELLILAAKFHNALKLYSAENGKKIRNYADLPVRLPEKLINLLESYESEKKLMNSKAPKRTGIFLNMIVRWSNGKEERGWTRDALVEMSDNDMAVWEVGECIENARSWLGTEKNDEDTE